MMLLIPQALVDNLPPIAVSLLVTMIPYTPFGVIVFATLFIIIYMTDIFGLGGNNVHSCKYNKLESVHTTGIWASMKNAYWFYFLIMTVVNFYTVQNVVQWNVVPVPALV